MEGKVEERLEDEGPEFIHGGGRLFSHLHTCNTEESQQRQDTHTNRATFFFLVFSTHPSVFPVCPAVAARPGRWTWIVLVFAKEARWVC